MLHRTVFSSARQLQRRCATSGPRIATSQVAGESYCATTTISDKHTSYIVDEPVALGGKGSGATPLAHFLGSLIGCTQITLHTVAMEQHIKVGHVRWKATGKFDLRGLRGDPGAVARFQEIHLLGEIETYFPERRLKEITDEVKRRCIISSTIDSSPHTKLTTELKAAPKVFKSSMGHWLDQH